MREISIIFDINDRDIFETLWDWCPVWMYNSPMRENSLPEEWGYFYTPDMKCKIRCLAYNPDYKEND